MSGNNYYFTKAGIDDLPQLKKIAQQVIRHNYTSFLGQEAVESFISSGASDKEIEDNLPDCTLLKIEDEIMSFGITFGNLIHLIMVGVPYQRKSYGTMLMQYLESKLFEQYNEISLQTFSANKNAIGFYVKNGWAVAETKNESGMELIIFSKTKQ